MLEKEIEAKFVEKVKAAGGRAYKFVSPGNDGVPDRLVVLPGGHIGFVELKQKGKKPTKLQAKQMQRLKELGCFVCVLDNQDEIETVISEIAKGTKKKERADYSVECDKDDDNRTNPCWQCRHFCFPIGCMLGEDD